MGWVSSVAPGIPVSPGDQCASAIHRILSTDALFSSIFGGRIYRRDIHDPSEDAIRPRCIVSLFSRTTELRISRTEKDQGTFYVTFEYSQFFADLATGEPSIDSVANLAEGLILRNPKLQVDDGPVLAQSINIPQFVAIPTQLAAGARYYAPLHVNVTYRQGIQDRQVLSPFRKG